MKFQVRHKDKCPCGSGREYRKCHSPKRNKSGDNLWKGPGFRQAVYLGYEEPLTGFKFEKQQKGEIVLLKHDDRIPVGKYFCINERILTHSVIVRSLSVLQTHARLVFSGSLEIKAETKESVPILLGTADIDLVDDFEVNVSGKPVPYERGRWFGFIGEDDNPIARIKKTPQWFRFFKVSGFLTQFQPPGELYFKLSQKTQGLNLFTLALPFEDIEISCPRIALESDLFACHMKIEPVHVSWDLVLHPEMFDEERRVRKDSMTFLARKDDSEVKFERFKPGVRKHFSNPCKLRLSFSLPSESPTMAKFAEILENSIRTIAEDPRPDFLKEGDRLLEADFRDYILTILKGASYFTFAEPARKEGFVDILVRYHDFEAIIEFKVWGRTKYRDVIKQVLDYGTSWTTEYSTVMINPNKNPILDNFMSNTKRSPGFLNFSYYDEKFTPVQKLVSYHYIPTWEKYVSVVHFIINLALL